MFGVQNTCSTHLNSVLLGQIRLVDSFQYSVFPCLNDCTKSRKTNMTSMLMDLRGIALASVLLLSCHFLFSVSRDPHGIIALN
jgi:hypothetical protein